MATCMASVGAVICFAGYMLVWRYQEAKKASPVYLNVAFSKLTSQPGIEWFPSLSRPTESGWCIRVVAVGAARFICRASAGRLPSISVGIQR